MKKIESNKQLIELLMERYPDTIPTTEQTYYELGKLVGQQEVVKHLVDLLKYKKEEEEIK